VAVEFYEARNELPVMHMVLAKVDPTGKQDARKADGEAGSDFFKANLGVLLWFVLLAFGGGLLALYYTSIDYFPDIEWQESLTYLGVLSIIGGTIVLCYALLLFVPGVIWSEFLIFDDDMKWHLCYEGYKDLEPCIMALLWRIALPFMVFIVPIHLLLSAFPGVSPGVWALPLMVAACFVAYRINRNDTFRQSVHGLTHLSISGRYMAFFVFSMLANLAALLFIRKFLVEKVSAFAPLSMICTGMIILSNIAVALQFKKRRFSACVSGIMATLVLLVAGHLLSTGEKPSVRFMSSFGLGSPVTMVLDERGAQIFKLHGIDVIPPIPLPNGDGQQKKLDNSSALFKAEGIEILSRLGSEYFLRSPSRQQRFSVPKKDVISWSYDGIPPVVASGRSVPAADAPQRVASRSPMQP
jgi:hypothetical protein